LEIYFIVALPLSGAPSLACEPAKSSSFPPFLMPSITRKRSWTILPSPLSFFPPILPLFLERMFALFFSPLSGRKADFHPLAFPFPFSSFFGVSFCVLNAKGELEVDPLPLFSTFHPWRGRNETTSTAEHEAHVFLFLPFFFLSRPASSLWRKCGSSPLLPSAAAIGEDEAVFIDSFSFSLPLFWLVVNRIPFFFPPLFLYLAPYNQAKRLMSGFSSPRQKSSPLLFFFPMGRRRNHPPLFFLPTLHASWLVGKELGMISPFSFFVTLSLYRPKYDRTSSFLFPFSPWILIPCGVNSGCLLSPFPFLLRTARIRQH